MTRVCFDYDPILYEAGFVGETRSIHVVHRQSGDEYDFPNRTAFFGHWKKKAGGYLAEWNSAKSEAKQRKPEEFDITDVQEPEPIANVIHTMKKIITGITEACGMDDGYYGYSGKGEVFRVDVSTVIKYKGQRANLLKPVHLDELRDYLVRHQGCTIVEKIEADDACTIDCYEWYQRWKKSQSNKDKLVLAFVDKDYWQSPGHMYNTNDATGVETCDGGFGKLWLNDKGEVKGRGRMWLYFQTMNGDTADNYFANSGNPDVKWADKSAYNVLKDARNDQEALQALVTGYKTIYPSPRKIVGWRGDEIEIDWKYMLAENFTLARMLRWRDDKVDILEVMKKQGVQF